MSDPLFDTYSDDSNTEVEESSKFGFLTTLILLLMILALLTTLFWPLIRQQGTRYIRPPTPTPFFLQEA